MTEVGEDLVEKILSTLPPKTLMRFRCASKGWYSLINNPRFVAKHLSNFNSNSKHLLVMKKSLVLKDIKDTTNDTEQEDKEEELVFSMLNLCNNDDDVDNGEDRIIVSSVEDIKIPLCMSLKTRGGAGHIVAHCNGIICLLLFKNFQVIVWNPAIQEFKLLPPSPYIPDDDGSGGFYSHDVHGFGYDAKLNEYKVVHIGLRSKNLRDDVYDVHNCPKAAIYSLSTDSWKKINTNALETEKTVFWPESFQIQFKEMFYWLGDERHKELDILDSEDLIIRKVIILLDIQNELFCDIMLPDCFYNPWVITSCMTLRVWNESLAVFAMVDEFEGYRTELKLSFVIWVLDELGGPKGACWTRHTTLEPTEKPLAFLNGNDILLADFMELVLSYDLGSKRLDENFIQNTPYFAILSNYDSSAAVVYVKSIVTVLAAHNLESRDNSSVANLSPLPYFPSSPSIADREWHSYSIWAIPPGDVSLRIKKVMEGLRAEFGGPEIEPHIPIVASIRMTFEDVLKKFRSLPSEKCHAFQAKVNLLVTTNFYYQCVSLLIEKGDSCSQLNYTTAISNEHFGFYWYAPGGRPYLSLLYGNLTEEERKIALEKVSILDESISSLSFTVAQLALYKIKYRDTTLKSWEKIAEYTLPLP